MTLTEILAEEIRDALIRAAADQRIQAAAIRVDIAPLLRTRDGYLIPITIKSNRREIFQFTVAVALTDTIRTRV